MPGTVLERNRKRLDELIAALKNANITNTDEIIEELTTVATDAKNSIPSNSNHLDENGIQMIIGSAIATQDIFAIVDSSKAMQKEMTEDEISEADKDAINRIKDIYNQAAHISRQLASGVKITREGKFVRLTERDEKSLRSKLEIKFEALKEHGVMSNIQYPTGEGNARIVGFGDLGTLGTDLGPLGRTAVLVRNQIQTSTSSAR